MTADSWPVFAVPGGAVPAAFHLVPGFRQAEQADGETFLCAVSRQIWPVVAGAYTLRQRGVTYQIPPCIAAPLVARGQHHLRLQVLWRLQRTLPAARQAVRLARQQLLDGETDPAAAYSDWHRQVLAIEDPLVDLDLDLQLLIGVIAIQGGPEDPLLVERRAQARPEGPPRDEENPPQGLGPGGREPADR